MRKLLIIGLLIFSGLYGRSQDFGVLSLEDCYKLVRENAPQLEKLNIIEQQTSIENRKIQTGYLPQLSAFGKAWYQSDAMSINLPIPTMEGIEVSQFQYNAAVNLDQKIFDGGIISIQKEINSIRGDIQSLETEVGLYKLNDIVVKLFFGIITLEKARSILELKIETLNEQQKIVSSGVENGMVKMAELDRMNSEIIQAQQQVNETELSIEKLEKKLKILCGIESDKQINCEIPTKVERVDTLSRPELELFESNRNFLEASQTLQSKRYIPQLSAYGQAGYSYPGYNFFENEPAGFYQVGVKMAWNIFDWNKAKSEKQIIALNIDQVNIQENDFLRNIEIEESSIESEIENLEQLMNQDSLIINLRISITRASSAAFKNGAATSVEYLNDLNMELKARLDYERHNISLIESKAKLALLHGKRSN
ncbi:MAG: TolC family protein [Bacteroidales bacterium]|nr:TolC family protein [Bacteroidales bacterium]MBN2818284.1 TolC family protein [Bacteroidales bacterium]